MRKFLFKAMPWGILPLISASLWSDDLQTFLTNEKIELHELAVNDEASNIVGLYNKTPKAVKSPPTRMKNSEENISYPAYPRMAQWASTTAWADFLYLEAIEENLEPAGLKTGLILVGFSGANTGYFINPPFQYKPAFQTGIGVNFDQRNMDLWVEYMRYVSTINGSGSNNAYYPMQIDPATILAFLNGINIAGGALGSAQPNSYDESWTLKMNWIDFLTGFIMNPTKIIAWHPYAGLRGGWINQQLGLYYLGTYVNNGPVLGFLQAKSSTQSWAIGPRIGMDVNFCMGSGFSFYSDLAADLLYTQYNYSYNAITVVPGSNVSWETDVYTKNIPTVRSHLELELGFRWSAYFNCHRQLLELSAGYGFQVFYDQNMFRHSDTAYEEIIPSGSSSGLLSGIISSPDGSVPTGNLYLHGLRVEGKISF